MPGTKEHSGGKREGAGRKPASFRIKVGDVFSVYEREGAGQTMMEIGTVKEITRTRLVIAVRGREIVIIR